jgi:soluble lytic murein transglycosylase
LFFFSASGSHPAFGQKKPAPQSKPPAKTATVKSRAAKPGAPAPKSPAAEATLESLARNLRDSDTQRNYEALASFARANSKSVAGQRAALALGYRDFTVRRFVPARQWLAMAANDDLLFQYALYWDASTLRSLGDDDVALKKFEAHRRDFPESIMAAQAVQAIAELSLSLGEPGRALAVLKSLPDVEGKPWLLILRARARELSGARLDAINDYLTLFYDLPLSEQSRTAGSRIVALRQMGNPEAFAVSLQRKFARADSFFTAKRWREARAEFENLLPDAQGGLRERAQLRIAQCRIQLGASPKLVAAQKFADPDAEAERLLVLAQLYRTRRNGDEPAMLAAIEKLAAEFPKSLLAEEALTLGGNYFWSQLDRTRAVEFYERLLAAFPGGKNALHAHWRITWAGYMERRSGVANQFEEHLRRYPASEYAENALYWLGRVAEREGDSSRARFLYLKLRERYPETYYGACAAERLREIGDSPAPFQDIAQLIPAVKPAPALTNSVPPAASERWKRAQALRSISFDASAELELRAAHAASPSPRLLLEAAKSALDAGRFMPGVAAARQVVPQMEARRWEEVPAEVWRTAYPVVYEPEIEKYSAKRDLDAALVAGIIRQESVFDRQAVSRAGAVGLMQVLPSTGRQLARRERIGYARRKLTNPEFNIRLGTMHLRKLMDQFGTIEAVLAAYNAGENRVIEWRAGRTYEEPAEFVESIPFTETREYVQIVSRNAEIYRKLYKQNSLARRSVGSE